MQCNCGNNAGKTASATTRVKGAGTWLLTFNECTRCERVGGELLRYQPTNGQPQLIAQGVTARTQYLDIERGTYPALPQHPAALEKTLEQKLASLLTTGPKPEDWAKPDPAKSLNTGSTLRGRQFLICHAGDWEISVLYFSWIYKCSWQVYVPLLDYHHEIDRHDIDIVFGAHKRIVAYLSDTLSTVATRHATTCAPPMEHPVQIRNLVTGETITKPIQPTTPAPEPAQLAPSPPVTEPEQCALF